MAISPLGIVCPKGINVIGRVGPVFSKEYYISTTDLATRIDSRTYVVDSILPEQESDWPLCLYEVAGSGGAFSPILYVLRGIVMS